jgi:O-antigen/teichoic acid export membrane protein
MKKYSKMFETGGVLQDLKGKSIRGGFYSIVAETLTQVIRLGSIVILARLILPEHFGLVSMVMALTIFAERLKHLGLSSATIQHKDITHEQVSTLFWINTGMGLLIAAVIVGLSPVIASFYSEPRLIPISLALSLTFVFSGLNVQHEALLRRQMRFRDLAIIQVTSNVFSIWLAIELALRGYTYWALVWREVARPAVEIIGFWLACRWWPGLPKLSSGVRPLLQVGRNIVSSESMYWFSRSVDQVLLGRFAGTHALGLYRQAFQLIALPMTQLCNPVGAVTLPSLITLRDQPDRYRRYFEKIVGLLFFLAFPLVTYMAIFSEDIIGTVLGNKWTAAAGIFRVLALAALAEPVVAICGMVMMTQGKTALLFRWSVMYGISLVTGFLIGVKWGAIGVAIGYMVAQYLVMAPSLWLSFRGTPVSINVFMKAISKPALFSAILGAVLIFLNYWTESLQSILRIEISLLTAGVVYLGLWILPASGKEHLFDDISSIVSAFKAPKAISK